MGPELGLLKISWFQQQNYDAPGGLFSDAGCLFPVGPSVFRLSGAPCHNFVLQDSLFYLSEGLF